MLYLYTRLRWYAREHGGYYTGFKFTANEKYNVLPKIIQKGWINKNKVFKHRSICINLGCLLLWSNIEQRHLDSLDSFKGFVISVAESSALKSRHRFIRGEKKIVDWRSKTIDKRHWSYASAAPYWLQVKKMSGCQYLGRVYNSHLMKVMDVSARTISRWRKYSENSYRYTNRIETHPYFNGRGEEQCFRNQTGKFITKDLTILSSKRTFTLPYLNKIL